MNNTNPQLSVIGGTGFLGKHFVEIMLKKGIKPKLLIHNKKPLNHGIGGPYTNVIGLNLKEMRSQKE